MHTQVSVICKMPQEILSVKPNMKKRSGMPRVRSHTDAELHYYREQQEDVLPSQFRFVCLFFRYSFLALQGSV